MCYTAGFGGLCSSAGLDPEFHTKRQHNVWSGEERILVWPGCVGMCPSAWLRAPSRWRWNWDWRKGINYWMAVVDCLKTFALGQKGGTSTTNTNFCDNQYMLSQKCTKNPCMWLNDILFVLYLRVLKMCLFGQCICLASNNLLQLSFNKKKELVIDKLKVIDLFHELANTEVWLPASYLFKTC